jgi:threonine/homoserine/homoserine lactone efflux protein
VSAQLLGFVGVAILVIITPGQDTALTIRNTLVGGRRGGIATAFGVVTGHLTWTVATSAGLAAVLLASEPAFQAIKLIGAAYLLFLGLQSLRSAIRPGHRTDLTEAGGTGQRPAALGVYRQGLISNLSNAKIAVFFTSLLPQFAPAGASFWQLLRLGVLFSLMALTWLTIYSIVVAQAGNFLRRARVRRVLDGILGTVLVGFGVRLLAAHR